MARTVTATEPLDLGKVRDELLDGLDTHARADGSVVTVKANGHTIAEVCVGARKVRLNFKAKPAKLPKNVELSGHSKSWEGGGINVDGSNVKQARAALAAVVAAVPAPKQAEPTAAQLATEQRKRTAARTTEAQRVAALGKRTGRKTAAAAK